MHDQERRRHMPWQGTKPQHIGSTTVHAYKRPEGYYASIATNPARLCDPNGWSLAPVGMIADLLGAVWEYLEAQIGVEIPLDQARVSRLDVARDFTSVMAPDRFLNRLSLDYMTSRHLTGHAYRGRNGGKTLTWVTKSAGRISLYDKTRESGDLAPPGTLRFEVQAHGWLTRYGNDIRHVGDITPVAAESLLRERWTASRMGTPVTSADRFVSDLQKVIREQGLGSTVYRNVRAYALDLVDGQDIPADLQPSDTTRRKYNAIIAKVGSLPSAGIGDGKKLSYLDLDEGREVVVAASDEAGTAPQNL